MAKTADYYRALPYTRRLRLERDEGGEYFVAAIAELPGVEGSGSTDVEALAVLAEAFEDYLTAMLEWDAEIPEPLPWPQSVGWAGDAPALRFGPVSIVGDSMVEVGDQPNFDRLEDFEGAQELARSTETVAV